MRRIFKTQLQIYQSYCGLFGQVWCSGSFSRGFAYAPVLPHAGCESKSWNIGLNNSINGFGINEHAALFAKLYAK